LYDKAPATLEYELNQDKSEIVALKSASDFASITISWGSAVENSTNTIDNSVCTGRFPGTLSANDIPILKVDLTNTAGSLSRSGLISSTDYLYLVACNGSGSTSYTYSPATKGKVVQVDCSAGVGVGGIRPCSVKINFSAPASDSYLAHIKPIYSSAKVNITGSDLASNPVEFLDAQISIDVTARANDIVRRLRASIPIAPVDGAPEAVFHSFDGVCKLLNVDTTSGTVEDTCN